MNLSGSPIDLIFAFFYGILASFTPCVYPLVPVIIGYIGAGPAESRFKGFCLSLTYVTGIATTYSLLGLVATLTGSVFGTFSALPQVRIATGAVIVLFGLSMLELFFLPGIGLKRLPGLKKRSYFSVFFLGASSGLLISPCLTPVLGAILSYLATQKNLLHGTLLLFSFAYGMGLVLIIAGSSGGIFSALPKAGKWTVFIKKGCALLLIGAGIYFIFTGIRRL